MIQNVPQKGPTVIGSAGFIYKKRLQLSRLHASNPASIKVALDVALDVVLTCLYAHLPPNKVRVLRENFNGKAAQGDFAFPNF